MLYVLPHPQCAAQASRLQPGDAVGCCSSDGPFPKNVRCCGMEVCVAVMGLQYSHEIG